ncbi:2TM domain-containing protein [Lysinibacter sp. HNR]|uniref:2TM domain-containing protein n=1 Tax=Lysinibacter sp. HNR TaxID=3031408 RepID=UPI002434D5C6|nr:2TM domain-containing protein [Lysinibacter sp. HNR]WGD38553.1 2TM domain-containing protein [Lysinibacter sp. HNR]
MHSTEEELEKQARSIVIAKMTYKYVVLLWALVIAGLVLIWSLTTPGGYFWPMWPAFGMGIAATFWGLSLYGRGPFHVKQSQVEKEMERLRSQQGR